MTLVKAQARQRLERVLNFMTNNQKRIGKAKFPKIKQGVQ
jgi:hypothetical protein